MIARPGFSFLENEETKDVTEKFSYVIYKLEAHSKWFGDVATFIGSNTIVHQAIATLAAKP